MHDLPKKAFKGRDNNVKNLHIFKVNPNRTGKAKKSFFFGNVVNV